MEAPGGEGAPKSAIRAVDETSILPYFLDEVRRQDLHSPCTHNNIGSRDRRTLRTSASNNFGGGLSKPQEWPLAAAVERRKGSSAALALVNGETPRGGARGPISKADWLTASLESAVKSSDALPLFNHLRTLTSRLFSEDESLKKQAPRNAKMSFQQAQKGRLPCLQSLDAEDAVRLAHHLAQENSYLETFISTDARVLQSAALMKAQRELAAALQSNRRLQQQAEKDRQVIVELELRSRLFADAYAWLTSHNRMIHAKDAPALVALWRKRVAATSAAKRGPVAPEFIKDLAEAYAAVDSEGDTETASEDGREKEKEDLLAAAELREAEAVSEARQAQSRAALAEARAVAAEQQLAAAKAQLERLTSAAAASALAAAAASASLSSPTPVGEGEEHMHAALRDSEGRAKTAENECARMKTALETLQASLDRAASERQRLEQELAEAVAAAEAKLTAQAEQHAAELAQLQAEHSQVVRSFEGSVHEAEKLRRELDEVRQQCAGLSAELVAAKEKGTGEGFTNVASPGGLASPPASDISTLTSERNSYKATALRLEMDIKRLSARAAEATQLEKTVAALKEKLQAGEELKTAYEALQKEAQTLKGQLSSRQSPPVAPAGPEIPAKAIDITAITRERDALREEVAALKKQLAKLREEIEILKTQGRGLKKPPVTGPEDTSCEETTLAAAEVAEILKERNCLQERVRALEEEVEALRASATSLAQASQAPKRISSPTSTPQTSQPPQSKQHPAPTPKDRAVPISAEMSASAESGITGERDKIDKPPEVLSPCVAKVQLGPLPPASPNGVLAAAVSSADARASSPKASPATVAVLAKKVGPSAGAKALPPKIVGKTLTVAPSQGELQRPESEDSAEAALSKYAGRVVSKPVPSAFMPKVAVSPAAALSSEVTSSHGGAACQPEPQIASEGKGEAEVISTKILGPSAKKKVAPSLSSKAARPKTVPAATDLGGADTRLEDNVVAKPKTPVTKTSEPSVGMKAPGAVLDQDRKTHSGDSGVSGGDAGTPPPAAAAASENAAAKSTAASVDAAKSVGMTLPKTLAKGTKVPAPPKKAPPVEAPVPSEEVFSKEAKQMLEKEVADLREQLAAREELKKAYETLQKENESLQAKLDAAGAPTKPAGPPSAGPRCGDCASMAKERDELAKKVKALEQELSVLRESQKTPSVSKAPPDRKFIQGSKALAIVKASPEHSDTPVAKGLAEGAPTRPGEEAAAEARAKLENLEREVVMLRQQLADGQKIKDDYAVLVEEASKLRSENEAFKMQGAGPPATPGNVSEGANSKERTLTAAEAAALVKERNTLQERVRALEEELAALRALTRSPDKASPAPKGAASPTPTPQILQPPSKKPPATAAKLGKAVSRPSTPDHHETSAGDDGARASCEPAEPPIAGAKPKLLPPKAAKAVAKAPPGTAAPAAEADAGAPSLVMVGPPVSKTQPGPLQAKGAKATCAAATPAESATTTTAAQAEVKDTAAAAVESVKSPATLPLKTASPKGPPVATSVEQSASVALAKASKRPEAPLGKKEPGTVLDQDRKTHSGDSGVSGGDAGTPPPAAAAASENAAAKSTAASVDAAKSVGMTLPKTLAKGTKVPAPPKKAPPVEAPVPSEEVFSKEAKQMLEKEVADLREQLAAREELKKAYETLQKENESLQAKLDAAGAPTKPAGPPSAGAKSVEKPEKAILEKMQLKPTAELEAELGVMRRKAAAAEELEKDIKRLQEQLRASEELRAAYEALQREAEQLKEQLSELGRKGGQPKEPVGTQAVDKGHLPAAGELEAVLRERDELREKVRGLEKEMTALAASIEQPGTVTLAAKGVPGQRGSEGALPSKKPTAPLLKKEQVDSAKAGAVALPAGEQGEKTSPEEIGEVISRAAGVLSPVPAAAAEAGATASPVGGKFPPPMKLEPSVGKTALSSTGKKSSISKKAEQPIKHGETLPKRANKAPPPPPKLAESDTKVPPPPKKAPPVEAPTGDGVGFNAEAKGNLEKEIASLREQLAAAGELKKTHEALQKEFESLQGELRALKAQAKGGGIEVKPETGEVENSERHESELLRTERNSLKERVAALEAELSTLRGAQSREVETSPPKLEPGQSPLPAKTPKEAGTKAKEAQTPEVDGERKGETPLSSADAEAAKEDTDGEAKPVLHPEKQAAGEGPPSKATLLTEEVLSKSDAETEEGDSEMDTSPAEERVAELTERLHRAKRRVRNLVIKCNALVEMEKERDALRSRLESLQAKHEAISKLHEKEAKGKSAMTGADKSEGSDMLKSASAVTLPVSAVASTVADDPESVSTTKTGLTTQSSSALLDVRPPADWAAKYEKLKAQRDKVYQAYKAQKERLTKLEEEETITKEKLERLERLYEDTKEELEIATRSPKQREGTESTGILSWLGGGAHDEKTPEEQKLRARLELLQQRLQKALAENEALSDKLAQMRTSPAGSPRGDREAGDQATSQESQGTDSQHLSPDAVVKKEGSVPLRTKAVIAAPPGSFRGGDSVDSDAERKSLAELKEQIRQKDVQIDKYKAEILELKTAATPASPVAAELAKREEELQAKAAELEKVTKEALEKDNVIKEKTEEIKTLKASLEALEKEKQQALSDNSALKKELATLQNELDSLKAGRPAPTPAKEKPKPPASADATPSSTKAVRRSSSIAKRMPGLPPPAPASKADRSDTAVASAAREEAQQAANLNPTQEVTTGPTGDQLPKPEERSAEVDEEGEPSHNEASGAQTVSKKKPKKTNAEVDGEHKQKKSPKEEDLEGTKKKKKKKRKGDAPSERSGQPSDVESINQENAGETVAAADATPGWGFGLFGNREGITDASKRHSDAQDASPSAPRPSLLGLIVGSDHAEETPKGNEVPPLKLSTVDGADDQSDSSSSDDGETDGGITSTIAGFFWGI